MPIYEYRCTNCGQVFEKLILGRDASVECPSCPGAAVEKQFSAFSYKGVRGTGSEVRGAGGGGGGCAPSG